MSMISLLAAIYQPNITWANHKVPWLTECITQCLEPITTSLITGSTRFNLDISLSSSPLLFSCKSSISSTAEESEINQIFWAIHAQTGFIGPLLYLSLCFNGLSQLSSTSFSNSTNIMGWLHNNGCLQFLLLLLLYCCLNCWDCYPSEFQKMVQMAQHFKLNNWWLRIVTGKVKRANSGNSFQRKRRWQSDSSIYFTFKAEN